MVGAPGSNIPAGICGLSERQLIGTAKGWKKKKQPGNEMKGGSWRPVYALQSLYGPVFPSELSIAMKLVLMTIRTKGILIDLQYSDISSIRKRWLSRPNDSGDLHEFRYDSGFAIQHPTKVHDKTACC